MNGSPNSCRDWQAGHAHLGRKRGARVRYEARFESPMRFRGRATRDRGGGKRGRIPSVKLLGEPYCILNAEPRCSADWGAMCAWWNGRIKTSDSRWLKTKLQGENVLAICSELPST